MSVPLVRSPVAAHTAEDTTLPPSRGMPGKTLKTASNPLAHTSHSTTLPTVPVTTPDCTVIHAATAITAFATGPAIAVTPTTPGVMPRASNVVWPPHRVRTMALTFRP